MHVTRRLLTVLCYFLPFTFFITTCNGLTEVNFSYNQVQADSNFLSQQQSSKATTLIADTSSVIETQTDIDKQIILRYTLQNSSNNTTKNSNLIDQIAEGILMPTDQSLSGIRSVFYFKNLAGKIAIAISLFCSLILLLTFKFLKSKKTKLYFSSASLLCLLIFIVDSLISEVTLKWGTWIVLLFLLFH